jgi:photosystem II stability/assembly factor-like uncharacterized protein
MIRGLLALLSFPTLGFAQSFWQLQNTNFPPGVWAVSLSAPNEQVCWAAGNLWPPDTGGPYAGYSRTTDGGNTWVCDSIPGAEGGYLSQIVALDADTAYAAVFVLTASNSKGVYKTTDGGTTWTKQNAYGSSGMGAGYIYFFDAQNGVVIGDPGLETYTTTNGGLNWNQVSMPSPVSNEYTWSGGRSIAGAGNRVWFGTTRRLLCSTDRGYTWSASSPLPDTTLWFYALAFQDSNTGISAEGPGSSYRKTTDGGVTWNDFDHLAISDIAGSCIRHIPGTTGTYLVSGWSPRAYGFAGTDNAGQDWTVIDYSRNYVISFPSERVGWGAYAGPDTVYKYVGPPVRPIVAVGDQNPVPASYLLAQNYPNPFNPTTTITYELPKSSIVRLSVFDMLGREVAVLVNKSEDAGVHEVMFDGSGLSSGVYLYRLRAGDFVQTRKLVLLR